MTRTNNHDRSICKSNVALTVKLHQDQMKLCHGLHRMQKIGEIIPKSGALKRHTLELLKSANPVTTCFWFEKCS